jgi:hypothetical protein
VNVTASGARAFCANAGRGATTAATTAAATTEELTKDVRRVLFRLYTATSTKSRRGKLHDLKVHFYPVSALKPRPKSRFALIFPTLHGRERLENQPLEKPKSTPRTFGEWKKEHGLLHQKSI